MPEAACALAAGPVTSTAAAPAISTILASRLMRYVMVCPPPSRMLLPTGFDTLRPGRKTFPLNVTRMAERTPRATAPRLDFVIEAPVSRGRADPAHATDGSYRV
ncbi:hypothetical protein GCM10010388_49430 [Streptomyces mauvecolor]